MVTFAELEPTPALPKEGDLHSALGDWYMAVRNTKITELGVGDLARACRQEIFLEHVIPEVIHRLETDPCAGELYDGELLLALAGLPAPWPGFEIHSQTILDAINAVMLTDRDIHTPLKARLLKFREQVLTVQHRS